MISMIESAIGAGLVSLACCLYDSTARLGPALVRAVDLTDVATPADMEQAPALWTSSFSERLVVDHRSTRAELLAA